MIFPQFAIDIIRNSCYSIEREKERTTMNKKVKNVLETLNAILKENAGKRISIVDGGDILKFNNYGYYVTLYKGKVVLCDNIGKPLKVIISDNDKEALLFIKAGNTDYCVTIMDIESETISITL
ncbi:MAG: hypothetical protein [Bacteriophage sp.]|nr:MAG: hypothetical protein [Bacteriophage sp.]